MKQLLEGVTEVRLEWDDEQRKIDMFGRHLVIVLFQKDGAWMNLNVEMIRQGLSPYFVKYGRARRSHERYVEAQKEAQAHERGIWADPGAFRHYPDYATRLVWWNERAEAIARRRSSATERSDLMILGPRRRLGAPRGRSPERRSTVFGTPLATIPKKGLVLLPLSHRRGLDFMIVGSEAEIARPRSEEGGGQPALRDGRCRALQGRAAVPREDRDLVEDSARRLEPESAPASALISACRRWSHCAAGSRSSFASARMRSSSCCAASSGIIGSLLGAVFRLAADGFQQDLPPEGRQRSSRRCGCSRPGSGSPSRRSARSLAGFDPLADPARAGQRPRRARRDGGRGPRAQAASRSGTCSCGRSRRSSGSSPAARSAARGR